MMAIGVGCSLGPLLGSILNIYLSYINVFYFFAAYMFVLGMGSVMMFPSRIDVI